MGRLRDRAQPVPLSGEEGGGPPWIPVQPKDDGITVDPTKLIPVNKDPPPSAAPPSGKTDAQKAAETCAELNNTCWYFGGVFNPACLALWVYYGC